jgi:hypothetical protein
LHIFGTRFLLPVLAWASFAFAVVVAVVWVRSLFVTDRYWRQSLEDEGQYTFWTQDTLKTGSGGVGFNRVVQSGPRETERQVIADLERRYGPTPFHQKAEAAYPHFNFGVRDESKLGFKWGRFETPNPAGGPPLAVGVQFVMPLWPLLLLALPLPVVWFRHTTRLRRRERLGHCLGCGYDLRASPGRCPECGTVAGKEA